MWSPKKTTEPPWAVADFWKNANNFKMENSKEKSCLEFHGEQDGGIQNYLWTTNNENRSRYQNETLYYKSKLNATRVMKMQLNGIVFIKNKFQTTWHQEIHNLVQVAYLLKITWMTDFKELVLSPYLLQVVTPLPHFRDPCWAKGEAWRCLSFENRFKVQRFKWKMCRVSMAIQA